METARLHRWRRIAVERIGTIETVCRYPVKSMAGEEVPQAFVGRHANRAARRACQAALADRARLPGAQAGTRSRPLRGARLAGFSSSCQLVHRGLRFPPPRAGGASPQRDGKPVWAPDTSPTQGLPPARRPGNATNAMFSTPLPPCATVSPSCSPASSTFAPAADDPAPIRALSIIRDTVRLRSCSISVRSPTSCDWYGHRRLPPPRGDHRCRRTSGRAPTVAESRPLSIPYDGYVIYRTP